MGDHQSAEEARELYDALVKEEARVKELELEARKVAALEQQVKLQERRVEVEAMKARVGLGRVQGEVIESKALKEDDGGAERKVAQIGIGIENDVGAAAPSPRPSPTGGEGEEKSASVHLKVQQKASNVIWRMALNAPSWRSKLDWRAVPVPCGGSWGWLRRRWGF